MSSMHMQQRQQPVKTMLERYCCTAADCPGVPAAGLMPHCMLRPHYTSSDLQLQHRNRLAATDLEAANSCTAYISTFFT